MKRPVCVYALLIAAAAAPTSHGQAPASIAVHPAAIDIRHQRHP